MNHHAPHHQVTPANNHVIYDEEPANSNQSRALKILMLEDNENDAELIQMYLRLSRLNIACTLVSNRNDYTQALENEEFDVILSDHNLPQFSSLEALRIRNEVKYHVPFILVSGEIPKEYAVTILKEGANDYILKDRPQRLGIAITEAIKKQKAIADKLAAENELLKINERLRLVGQATADAIWDYDVKSNTIYRGEGFTKLFGYNLTDLPVDLNSWTDLIHPDDKKRVKVGVAALLENRSADQWVEEYRYLKADGTYATVRDKGIALRDDEGNVYRIVGAMQDVTHVRKLQMEILEKDLVHQKQNTEIVIQAQEQERNNIGKELHDNINQLIASAKMMIDTSRNRPEIRELCIDKSYESINLAIDEIRKLSHALAPPAFADYITFVNAVKDLADNINSYFTTNKLEITVNIYQDKEFNPRDEKITLSFYRIIQEQLTNIVKHAKASKASIDLEVERTAYLLRISDNGIGFKQTQDSSGIGLRNISSRVELHGGTIEIISSPGHGCTLLIKIPF